MEKKYKSKQIINIQSCCHYDGPYWLQETIKYQITVPITDQEIAQKYNFIFILE